MLAHRTGITRHDTIWYGRDFTRKELFERPSTWSPQSRCAAFLYNNMMYAGAGYVVELLVREDVGGVRPRADAQAARR